MVAKKTNRKDSSKDEPKFEQALERLEAIVKDLEEGELDLDRSLALFEEGVGLSRLCMKKLDEAQAKVELLLRDPEGQVRREPLDEDSAEDAESAEDTEDGKETA